MKRITPQHANPEAERYPSLVDEALPESTPPSRRTFLKGAAALGAALAGSLLPGEAARGAGAAPAKGAPRRVTLTLKRRYQFRYGNYELQRAVAQTAHAPLARFLADPKQAATVEAALRKVLDGHSCADLLNGKRLTQLQGRVGAALAALYRQRTRRAAPRPTVVLFVGTPELRCLGDCAPPTPVCRPPKP